MADIAVASIGGDAYRVTVTERGSSSTHEVTVTTAEVERLAAGHSAAELIDASFRFLLDREPKESILTRFDIGVISRYFGEYPSRIAEYL